MSEPSEFEKRLFNDPVAKAWFDAGRAYERDSQLTPDQRKAKYEEMVINAHQAGLLDEFKPITLEVLP